MKIQKIDIKNYRSLHKLTIYPEGILALVGRNNSGKSNLIKALELFFEGSVRLINDECLEKDIFQEDKDIIVDINTIEIFSEVYNYETYEEYFQLDIQTLINGIKSIDES